MFIYAAKNSAKIQPKTRISIYNPAIISVPSLAIHVLNIIDRMYTNRSLLCQTTTTIRTLPYSKQLKLIL